VEKSARGNSGGKGSETHWRTAAGICRLTIVAAEKSLASRWIKETHRQIIDKVLDESANLKKIKASG